MAYNGSSAANITDLKTEENLVSPLSMHRTIAGLLIVAVVVGSLGNFLVAVTILKNKKFRVPVYALLLQVAALDAVFQTIVVPINIYSLFHTFWTPSTAICSMILYATYMLLCASGLLLMLVSVYRCVLVCYSNLYLRIKNPRVVTAFCVFIWVETIVLMCVLGKRVSFSREYMTCVLEGAHLQTVLSIFIYLPMSLIPFAMYIKIAVFARNAQRLVRPEGNTSSRNHTESHELTRMTALISLNHIVTGVLPGIFFTVIPDDVTMRSKLTAIALVLFQLTAAFDVLIYIFSNKTLRFMIMNIFTSLRPLVTPRGTELQQGAANISGN